MNDYATMTVDAMVTLGNPLQGENPTALALESFGSIKRGEAHRRVYTMAKAAQQFRPSGLFTMDACACPLAEWAASKGRILDREAAHLACGGHGKMPSFGKASADAALALEGCACEGHDDDTALMALAALDSAIASATAEDRKWETMTPPERARRTNRDAKGKARVTARPDGGLGALAAQIWTNNGINPLRVKAAPVVTLAPLAAPLAPHTCGPRITGPAILQETDGTLVAYGPKGETWGSYGKRSKGCLGCLQGRETVNPAGPVALSPCWAGMHADTPAAKGRNKAIGGHTIGASRMDRTSPLAG